jgi:hypothetical protein
VDTPDQAIDYFMRTKMDAPAIGSFLVLESADATQNDAAFVPVGISTD